jgi:hypothetical protein
LCATCLFLRVTDLGEATFIYLGYSPWSVAGQKHRQLARQVGVLAEDLMANSTTSIVIKPTVVFNRGDTFVFGSWVCTADGAGSFQRRLTMPPMLTVKIRQPSHEFTFGVGISFIPPNQSIGTNPRGITSSRVHVGFGV